MAYSSTYFWRYPIFVLPLDTLEQTVFTIGGKDIDLQTSYSLALTLGMGLAKISAVSVISSPFFFRNRRVFIIINLWVSFLFMSLGTLVFYSEDVLYLQVICLFFSFYFASWLFGAMLSFIEGRMGTEALLATMNFCYLYAGNASRGTGQLLLEQGGLSARVMPAVVGGVFCCLGSVLMWYASHIPPPTPHDVENRAKRVAMSSQQRGAFLRENAFGLLCMLLPYALLSGMRGFRDYYSQQVRGGDGSASPMLLLNSVFVGVCVLSVQIFSATMGRDEVPSYMFFTVDIPGALLACVVQYSFHSVQRNSVAFVTMLGTMVVSVGGMLLCTTLFDLTGRESAVGFAWQVAVGMGLYVAYSLLSTAAYDRLFGLLRTEGTCTFMVFFGDGLGYTGTTAILFYNAFGRSSSDDDADDRESREDTLELFMSIVYAGSITVALCLSCAVVYFVKKSDTFDEVKHLLKSMYNTSDK